MKSINIQAKCERMRLYVSRPTKYLQILVKKNLTKII